MKINPLLTHFLYSKNIKEYRIMKISLFIMFVCVFQLLAVNTEAQNAIIELKSNNLSIEELFKEIEDQTNYLIIYSTEGIRQNFDVSLSKRKAKISDFLDESLNEQGLKYEFVNNYIILSKLETPSPQQNRRRLTGTVYDENRAPVIGANIVEKGNPANGTVTNVDGKFSLEVSNNAVLQVSYIGYNMQEVATSGKNDLVISLAEDSEVLDEVVVIGYGSRSKRDVTSAISTLGDKDIAKALTLDPQMAMQGQMSGVQVIGNLGNPNSRPTLRIRGTNTWGVSDPLYVIDGVPVREFGAGIEGGDAANYVRGNINIMAMIDPNDIESISVLKDASSAAIYGVRAANGVVLITTKRGRQEKTTIDYSQKLAFQNMHKRLDVMNTQEYASHIKGLYDSDSESIMSEEDYVFIPSYSGYLGDSPTYDWQEAFKNKNALLQDYSVRVSGGTDKTDYSLSFSYSDQEGVYVGSDLRRYSGAINFNFEINKYLRAGINYRLSLGNGESYWLGSIIDAAIIPPWTPIYDPKGLNGYAPVLEGYNAEGVWSNKRLYGSVTRSNPLGLYSAQQNKNRSLRNIGSAYIELEPIKDLKLRGTISVDNFSNDQFNFSEYAGAIFSFMGTDPSARGGIGSVGSYEERKTTNFNIIYEFTANYAKSFNNHNIDLLFNAMAQKYNVNYARGGTDYVTTTNPDLITLNGENQYTNVGEMNNRGALQGMLFRVGYNYNYKYYLDLTARRDGSSRFAPEVRWGVFPAVSAAWRIKNEAFMESISWLDELKLRAGWGQLGNQEVNDMAYLSPINTAPTYAWGNNPNNQGYGYTSSGATVYGMANRKLTWEKTNTLNIGIDAVVWKGFNFSFEYYDKLTNGILQTVSLPASVGVINQPVANIAKVRNSGIELNANYSGEIGDFFYSVGGNLTTVKNVVEETYGGIPLYSRGIEEGMPMFYIRGQQIDGRFQSEEEVAKWLETHEDVTYKGGRIKPGDYYFKDLRGAPKAEDIEKGINEYYSPEPDGIVDSYDQVYLGKTIPGYYYGLNLNLGWKGIDLSMQFTGVGDVQKTNTIRQTLGSMSNIGLNMLRELQDHWTPSTPDARYPRLIYQDPAGNTRFSDFFVTDADYLRLANLTVGYTLPDAVYKATQGVLRNARIYAGCSNLFTITNYEGLDPEDDRNPAPLMIFTGLSLKF
jgi:TonB-linked SusC/RagA family outer membrane protein